MKYRAVLQQSPSDESGHFDKLTNNIKQIIYKKKLKSHLNLDTK